MKKIWISYMITILLISPVFAEFYQYPKEYSGFTSIEIINTIKDPIFWGIILIVFGILLLIFGKMIAVLLIVLGIMLITLGNVEIQLFLKELLGNFF